MSNDEFLPPTRINQICDQFEDAWNQEATPNIADFITTNDPGVRKRLIEHLVPIDIELRTKANLPCEPIIYTALGSEAVNMAEKLLGRRLDEADQATLAPNLDPQTSIKMPTRNAAINLPDSKQIGRYKLLQVIGEGGMGTVWMAEQTEPIKRRVALKVIKTGMDTKQVIARFEAERQALALMNHENIARVLDVGTTGDGRPYFVMELVKGIPFIQYCDKNRLGIRERLELFIPICRAITHAHQKGIIHRDLKPSNVLVTLYDGAAVPKVIDFGLAKALDQQANLTDRTMFTEFGQVVGTLQYMSPEQAEMNALDVDTRTDIYSLGVILYELLTGTTPIEMKTLQKNALLQVLQTIRETEPPRPSIRLSQSGEAAAGFSEQRKIESGRLQQILRGELDWIVMKSLEKDRTRRYETAGSFADDVGRYLNDEPIAAKPTSVVYKVSKFVKKNRGLVAATLGLLAFLIAGVVGTGYGLIQAQRKSVQLLEEKENASVEAENARQAEAFAKLKEREAAAEAVKARESAELASANETKALHAQEEVEKTLARSNFFLATARFDDGRIEASRDLLSKIPSRLRKTEWNLIRQQLRGNDITLKGHMAEVHQVAFNSDGSKIVSSNPLDIRVWDSVSGRLKKRLRGREALFDQDDVRLVAKVDNEFGISLVDPSTDEEVLKFKGKHDSYVGQLLFSPDRTQLVSLGLDQTLKLWDVESGELQHTIPMQGIKRVRFNPTGTWIAAAGDDITLWDPSTGKEIKTIENSTAYSMNDINVNPEGTMIVSAGSDQLIKLWDIETGEVVRTLRGHLENPECVCFSADGTRICSGSADQTVKIWEVKTGKLLITRWGHTDTITCVAFSPDGSRVVSGSKDSTVKIWDATNADNLSVFRGHVEDVKSVCFSNDGKRLWSSSTDGSIRGWDCGSGAEVLRINEGVYSVCTGPVGKYLFGGSLDGLIIQYDANTGHELRAFLGHNNSVVTSVTCSHDGNTLVSCGDRVAKLWSLKTGKELFVLSGHTNVVLSAKFSPDDSMVATASYDGLVKVWDVKTGKELSVFKGQLLYPQPATCVAFSPDGKHIASGNWDKAIRIWDLETGEEVKKLLGHLKSLASICYSPDGTRIVSKSGGVQPSSDHTVKVWDVESGEELITLKGQTNEGSNIAFSPDGTQIAWANGGISERNDGSIRVWETKRRNRRSVRNSLWSALQARLAEEDENWYAATVNRAWEFKDNPDDPKRFYYLYGAYENLTGKKLKSAEAEEAKDETPQRFKLPEAVMEIIELPEPKPFDLPPRIAPDKAKQINDEIWEKVINAKFEIPTNQFAWLTHSEIESVREIRRQNYRNIQFLTTLMVAEYRLNHLAEAKMHAQDYLVKKREQEGKLVEGAPARLAVLAMVNFRVGKLESAEKYRKELIALIEGEKFRDNEEAKSFANEVEAMFKK